MPARVLTEMFDRTNFKKKTAPYVIQTVDRVAFKQRKSTMPITFYSMPQCSYFITVKILTQQGTHFKRPIFENENQNLYKREVLAQSKDKDMRVGSKGL